MRKHKHKIYFGLMVIVFSLTLTILYICDKDIIFGVVYPNNVKVQGDTLFGSDIKAGGQDFTSGTFNWTKLTDEVKTKIDKFIGLQPCLNPNIKCSDDINAVLRNINPDGKPEGQTWYYSGNNDIDIFGATISDKGTIIINGNNLKISGSINYEPGSNSSLGFVVMKNNLNNTGGNIEIEQGVAELVGAYYAQEKIIFKYLN